MRMIKTIVLIAGICIGLFVLMRTNGFQSSTAIFDVLSLFASMLLFSNLLLVIQRYYHSRDVLNTANTSVIILFTGLTILVNRGLALSMYSPQDLDYPEYLNSTLLYRVLIVAFVYFISLMFFWIDQQKIQEKRIQDFAIEKEREANKIELNSLQQQFKPHFLFNSLNSINALTISNPEEARRMVHLLSEFMRVAVKENHSELIPLEEEIRHIQLYTDIEKVRFGDRLTVDYTIDEAAIPLVLPSLILQPMIENAVKYGLYGHTEPVCINIHATSAEEQLIVTIENPFDASLQSSVKGTGYGLQSIEKKMLILYSQSNLLTIKKEDNIHSITLKIPQL
ncbi:MAG: histidine kinase [Crocinitomicaceae bacterium]|nr:histidine kinase [Crocinitomicaceae bacterium]